ncbi:MAG: DUF6265 family protein [Thermoanaerobaculia bacterium]
MTREMTSRAMGVLLLFAAVVAPASKAFAEGSAAPPPTVAALAFLSGSWELQNGALLIQEQWTCPGPDSMYATGRTVKNGRTVFFEFLRIEARADGIYYVAQPKGSAPTDFKLTRLAPGVVVFENPAHDFPKKITYAKGPGDTLVARVEGDAASQEKAEEFRYRRSAAACR